MSSTLETDIRATLLAVPALVTTLTGGIFAWSTIGRSGMTRAGVPSAFDTKGTFKPNLVIRALRKNRFPGIQSDKDKLSSYRQRLEVYIWADGRDGFDSIDTASQLVYATLQGLRLGQPHYARLRWVSSDDVRRDYAFDNSGYARLEFDVYGIKKG